MMSQQQELDLEEGDELERDNVKRNEIEKTSPKPGGGGGPDHHDINDHHDDHAPVTAGPCIQIHGHNQSHPPQIVVQTIEDDHDTGRPTDAGRSDEDVVSKVNTVLGPDIGGLVEGPLLLYMEDNSEKHFEVESKSSPSPNERPACPEEIICCSPEADFEVRKNLMSVLRSPSQSSSIGSLSTQISPSTCSPDFCGQDSVSISFDDSTDHNELLLCYPTFEELHKSYGFESPEIMMAKLNEVVQQKSVGSKKLGPGDVKSPVRASDSQDGNPAFTSPHILHGCPPQRTGPHRSQHGQPPRRVHLMSVPSTRGTDKGSVVLPAKGTPHPGQGIYIPGQCFPRGAFRYRTPTGYIIRHSAPSQKFPSATCVSPHASPANISLNSSGEEGSKTTPEEVTPPFRVPYNTPESGLANNPRYPHINRVLNDSNIMAELEEKRKCSPRTLEDFAKYQSPFPVESLSSDHLIDTDEVVFRKSRTQIGRVIHNATERKRRARIKQASDKLRRVVPGLTSKADKATVFEYAVKYILFMKKILGTENDRQFLSQS